MMRETHPHSRWLWISRLLIGVVLFFNLQAAVSFFLSPRSFLSSFGLTGPVGEGVIAGYGVLFLMWIVPYAVAVVHPSRFRISLVEATCMQLIGVVGETIILFRLPAGYPGPSATIARFILFDGLGFLALLAASWIVFSLLSVRRLNRLSARQLSP